MRREGGRKVETMELRKLDVRGAKCPVPIVKAKKMIDTMQVGELLEVLATDPGSVADFQGWAKVSKQAALKEQRTEKDETGREVYVHVVERKA
jgi:TusA-related sulfurtransferase